MFSLKGKLGLSDYLDRTQYIKSIKAMMHDIACIDYSVSFSA